MKIIPVVYGRSVLPESMAFAGGAKDRSLPIDFIVYYVETSGRRILIDAGCDTMPGFEMQDYIGPVAALREHGISHEDITDLIITHAHHDHIEGAKHFSQATVYIQKEAYESGKKHLTQNLNVVCFEERYSVCDGVEIVKIGGHSKGSCIVELQGADTCYVVSGDECYVRKCLTDKILTGVSCCPEKSRAFLEQYRDPRYTVLLCHEM